MMCFEMLIAKRDRGVTNGSFEKRVGDGLVENHCPAVWLPFVARAKMLSLTTRI
jgi:hypothetical protein